MEEKDLKNDIFSYYELFKKNLGIIILVIYGISFINYYLYYKSFEIPIFNYIGLNDMIFFFIEFLFKIVLLIFLTEIVLFIIYVILFSVYEKVILIFHKKARKLYLNSDKRNRQRINDRFDNCFSETINDFRITIVFLSIFIIPFIPYKMIIFPAYFIYIIYYLDKMAKEKISDFLIIFSAVIIFISMIISTLFNAHEKRFNKEDFVVSFYENEKFFTTDKDKSCYNYLGETSTHIFLFDIEHNQSIILNKSNISDLKIKNSNTIGETVEYIKSTFIYRSFHEMLQH